MAHKEPERWVFTNAINEGARQGLKQRVNHARAAEYTQSSNVIDLHAGRLKERVHIEGVLHHLQKRYEVFRGGGADLGSGSGLCTAIISQIPPVERIYAVDYSEDLVEFTMLRVFEVFKADTEKIIRVIGDFNNLQLPDGSLDFVVELGGFHHSEDLGRTLQEMYRVLRRGGVAVLIEKANADSLSDAEISSLLDRQLSAKQKELYGLPENYTRRMYGIHEYRYSEWIHMLKEHGFEVQVPHTWRFLYKTLARFWRIPKVRGLGTLYYYCRLGLFPEWRAGKRRTNCVFLARKPL